MYKVVVLVTLLCLFPVMGNTQKTQPFQIQAAVIDYNAKTGQMLTSGEGGVILTQGNLTMTGEAADYNVKTQAGIVKGNVKAIQDNVTLTAQVVEARENGHLTATGEVVLTKAEDRLYSPKLDYYSDKQTAIVEQNAKLITADGTITSDRLEAYFLEKRSVATGNVLIISDQRNLQARADQATYYEPLPGEQGKIVLTGNARAVQDGNTVVGETLTLYLDDRAVDASGQTKVVITPAS